MATINGAGVYFNLQDFSDYIPADNGIPVAIVGFASRGPVDEPVLISNAEQAYNIFGDPTQYTGGQGLLALHEILAINNQMYYVRAAAPTKATAIVDVSAGSCPFAVVSGLTDNYAHAFLVDVYDNAGSKVNSEPYVVATVSSTNSQIYEISQTIAAYIPTEAPFQFLSGAATYGYFVGKYPGSSARINVSALAISGSNGVFSSVGGAGAGGGGATFLTSSGVLATPTYSQLNQSNAAGSYFSLTSNKLFATLGVDWSNYITNSEWLAGTGVFSTVKGSSVAGYGNTLSATTTSGGALVLESLHVGAGYNYVTSSTADGLAAYGLQAVVAAKPGKDVSFDLYADGNLVESYLVDFVNSTTVTNWVLNKLNTLTYGNGNTSDFMYARFGKALSTGRYNDESDITYPTSYNGAFTVYPVLNLSGTANTTGSFTLRFPKLIAGTHNFTLGKNGDVADEGGSVSDSDVLNAIIGNTATKSGMQALRNPVIAIEAFIVPGFTSQQIQNAQVSLCEEVGTFYTLVSPPQSLPSEQRAMNWINGLGDGRTAALNNYFCDVAWPWVQGFDRFAGVDTYYDPAIMALYADVRTANLSEVWTPAAGLTYGRLTRFTDTEVDIDGNGGTLYNNNINPIMNFTAEGIVIWGQKTTQRATTAMDRKNVRNLVLSIKRDLTKVGRQFVFKPNDAVTWNAITTTFSPYLADIKSRRGLKSYRVICDSTVNTPARQDRSELWVKLIVQPTKAAEFIVIELNLTNQSGAVSVA
jgi:hypothetical protein